MLPPRATLLLLLLSGPALLLAQPEAKRLFEEAEQAIRLGDYAKAVRSAEAAAALWQRSGDERQLRSALNTAGAAHLHRAEYDAALPLLQRALQLDQKLDDRPGQVMRWNNLGGAFSFLGRFAEADESYQKALSVCEANPGQPWQPRSRMLSLGNLAVLYQTLGQNRRALAIYQQMRAGSAALQPNVRAQVLTNMAVVYRRLGDPPKALELYEQARSLLRSDPNAAAQLYALHNVGVVQARDLQAYPAALRTFSEALSIATATGSRREQVLERLLLGETLLRQGQPAAAAPHFAEALRAAEAMQLVDERWTALYGLAKVELATNPNPDSALTHLRQAIAVIEQARASLTNSLKEEFLAAKRDVYDDLIATLLAQPNPPHEEIFRRMEQSRSRSLKDALGKPDAASSLADLQRRLPDDVALLAYWQAGDRGAVAWVTRRHFGLTPLPPRHTWQPALNRLSAALASPHAGPWRPPAAELAAALLPPSLATPAALLQDALLQDTRLRHLVIVADGPLQGFPFEVLPLSPNQLLVERFAVSYLPSAQLFAAPPPPRRLFPWQQTLLAFADPLPPTSSASAETNAFNSQWPRLPFSEQEVRQVAQLLPGRATLALGPANQKSAFLLQAPAGPPLLHLATHAAMDQRDLRGSRLIFSAVPGQPAAQFLFQAEIARLALPSTELVTLAACESELGRFVPGEGIEGLSRAFLRAGASSVVSSLWRVNDQATAQFMPLLYASLAQGSGKALALRQAKLRFLTSGGTLAHPYYWAAFVLSGDGLGPVSRATPWWQLALAAALLLALFALARQLLRPAARPPR